MKVPVYFSFLLSGVLGISTVVLSQSRKPAPTLTTDDVIATRPSTPVPTSEANKTPQPKAPGTAAQPTPPTPAATAEETKKGAEKNWNEQVRQAQEKARNLALQADQTELQITQLRNQLFSATARPPEAQGQINNQIAQLSAQATQLRAASQAAQQAVETLQAEGKAKEYQLQAVALTNEKGEPNQSAYQDEYSKLQNELQAARARLEVLQLRVTNNQSDTLKKGNGDNFTLNRMRQEREQLSTEIADTRTKIEALTNQLQTHRQKAAAANVPLPQR